MKPGIRCLMVLAATLTLGAPAARAEDPCPDGRPRVADLGISSLECDCTFQGYSGVRPRAWRFRSEPEIRALRDGSPAAAVLHEGDVITAIDGHLITTREGGRRFANLSVGDPVTLSVRREGRVISTRLAPESVCPDQALFGLAPLVAVPPTPLLAPTPATPAVPGTPTPPRAPRAPRAPREPVQAWKWEAMAPRAEVFEVVPRGWFGMSLNCSNCKTERGDGDRAPVWTFTSAPEVAMVEPGSPAARAGMRAGDRITHIDRVLLTTDEGGRRFGAVRPGQNVEFTVLRGGAERRLNTVAGARHEPRTAEMEGMLDRMRGQLRSLDTERMTSEMARLEAELARLRARQTSEQNKRLRYAGSVGGSDVEVRGLHNVVVDDSGDEIVIITSDARIVIKPSGRSGDRKKK